MKLIYGGVIAGIVLVSSNSFACGGGGVSFRSWVEHTITSENAISAATHVGRVSSKSLDAVNSTLFTAAEFFSEKKNVEDFSKGKQTVEGLNEANKAVDSNVTGGGAMGFTSAQHDLTLEQYEDLFR